MHKDPSRILVFGAHPDDAEFFAGGFLHNHVAQGNAVRIISVTNGQSGHHSLPPDSLVQCRRMEASASAAVLGCVACVWDYPDGYLTPSIPVRESIIREIREFQPDLVLTHRPWDYHPDHRAVGQAIQDASYMVMVPKIVPGTPVPQREPVVAYMADLFTKPVPFQPDFVLDATPYLDGVVHMLAQHTSQLGEWLPWIEKIPVPHAVGSGEWVSWLKSWFLEKAQPRRDRFWQKQWGQPPLLVEAFEISEYAGRLSPQQIQILFPNCHQSLASSLTTKS